MNKSTKETVSLSEAKLDQIVNEVAKHIYEAELARGKERYGKEAINSLTFFYDIMPDWVEMIADHYGIDYHASYVGLNKLFEKAWNKAYDSLEPIKEQDLNENESDEDENDEYEPF